MPENSRIGVIYKGHIPRMLSMSPPAGMPWPFEYFEESAVLGLPVAPRLDFSVVFFPYEKDGVALPGRLINIFPGAEFFAYAPTSSSLEESSLTLEKGVPVVTIPMTILSAQLLFAGIAQKRAYRRELARERQIGTTTRELFDAFLETVESAWDVTERRASMNHLMAKILGRTGAQECVIYLVPQGEGGLGRAFTTGRIKHFDLFEHQTNRTIVQKVADSGEPYHASNCAHEIQVPFSSDKVVVRSILCLPIQRRGEIIGVIEILNKDGDAFTEQDREALLSFIDPIAVAVGTIRTFDSSERLTITDDLTKLYNYRYLMQYLDSEVKRCLRYKKRVSLLFIDVDGFKQINDTFGHIVGSSALAEMGNVLKRNLRDTDIIGRYGGDEFVIVLPETPLNGALIIAERIRKKVEDYDFVSQDLSIRLTVSLGVANCPRHTLTAEGLIKKADAAMYRAKELSKNTIRVAV